ncbi:hypothetical protein FSP39_017918 [Pinctada imbricata]|uniref:SAC3/GANP/THP3 conserved domain-containing protein n=1 Tax=Pinctada imbricata TaxID=66713 RepID=A0AA88Y6Z3_PINIB|nr:hypothetical protein FSP39_017918 [Pinctada imbricata]
MEEYGVNITKLQQQTVRGSCQKMCPDNEIKLRIREKLVHPLEMVTRNGRLEIDPDRIVKEYSRSAAGRHDPDPGDLRPASVLHQTVEYLLQQVILTDTRPWNEVYDFVFDRLRAVRQDMVIQNLNGHDAIRILERIIRFLVFSGYRLSEEEISVFDPTINNQHLQECMKRLLYIYREYDLQTDSRVNQDIHMDNRVEFECIYLLFNLGQSEAIMHYYDLPEKLRKQSIIHQCYLANIQYVLGNYVRVLRIIGSSTLVNHPLLLCAIHRHISGIQRKALEIYSYGFNSKALKFPIFKLVDLFWFPSEESCASVCQSCGLTVSLGEHVIFLKQNFKSPEKMWQYHLCGIDSALQKHKLDTLLVCGMTSLSESKKVDSNFIQNESEKT